MTTNWRALRCGCLILTSVMLGGNPAFVRGQESASANTTAAVISSVAITQEPQRAAIRVEGAGKLDVHPVRLQNPERLVLDFNGAKLSVQKTTIPGVSAPVRGVRMAQFRPDIARVVIDLTGSAPYEISHDGSAVVVYLKTAAGDANAPTAAASAAPAAPKKEIAASNKAAEADTQASVTPAAHFALPQQLTTQNSDLAIAEWVGGLHSSRGQPQAV